MKLDTIQIKGRSFDVDVNKEGKFGADFPNHGFKYFPTLDELKKGLTAYLNKAAFRCSIEFTRYDKERKALRHGRITGIHGRSNKILVKFDDGETAQEDSWRGGGWNFLRFPSTSEAEEYLKVCVELERLDAKRIATIEKFKFDPREEVQAAIDSQGHGRSCIANEPATHSESQESPA